MTMSTRIEPGTVVCGRYEVLRPLGEGATATVWVARHVEFTNKEVAIKVLSREHTRDADGYTRLRREADILSGLNHPNILQVLDFGELPDGTPCMVTERVGGETLRARLARGRLDLDLFLEITRQITAALAAAHTHGVVHRDLKPDNVILSPTLPGDAASVLVKVLDFGIAARAGSETMAGPADWQGSPQYMAPEQLMRGDLMPDQRADIFALGAMMYEMLSGRPAFSGSIQTVLFQVAYRDAEPLTHVAPHIPKSVIAVVERAMAKDPAQRFASATALSHALIEATFVASPTAQPTVTRAPSRNLVVLGLAVVAGAAVFWFGLPTLLPQSAWVGGEPPATSGSVRTDDIVVMTFENQRPHHDTDWIASALQAAVNTELNGIPQLNIVAPEEVRYMATSTGMDSMSTVRRLGVRRLITGSFAVFGNSIRIDARVVDARRGTQEVAATVEGPIAEFFTLQATLVRSILAQLRLKLRPRDAAPSAANPRGDMSKYRKFLESEGLGSAGDVAGPVGPQSRVLGLPSSAAGVVPRTAAQRSKVPEWPIHLVGAAYASAADPVDTEIRSVLEEYRRAHEEGDGERLAALYVAFPERQRRAVAEYAESVSDLRVELAHIEVQPRERDVRVSYTRRDRFVDKESGEPMSFEVHLTKFLVRDGDAWRFAAER